MKPKYTATEWALKQIYATTSTDEYPIINSISKNAYIIPVSNAWPERGGSAIKRIKTNKRSTMKNDAINALLMISINGPKSGTLVAKQLIVRSAKKYGERRRYKKAPAVGCTQTPVYITLEFQIQEEERLGTIINSENIYCFKNGRIER